MRLKLEKGTLHFLLNKLESHLLLHVFEQLAERYRLKPEEVDPKTASAWYSTRGCLTAKLSDQETRDWVDQVHALKSANLKRLERWTKQLEASPSKLSVRIEEAPAFVTAVNDHRLAAAALHEIGQAEMDIQSPLQLVKLPPNQQEALLEIHLLAWIMEETLRVLQGGPVPENPAET
jgi:hypothetical protein